MIGNLIRELFAVERHLGVRNGMNAGPNEHIQSMQRKGYPEMCLTTGGWSGLEVIKVGRNEIAEAEEMHVIFTSGNLVNRLGNVVS